MWTLSIALSSLVIGSIALAVSIYALVTILALKQSTHQVQFVPIDPKEAVDPKELEKKLHEPERLWEEDEL